MQYATWLYGSHARGDNDRLSDRDLLVVGPAAALRNTDVTDAVDANSSVSHYQWPEVTQMAAYGSLFLLHLRREGVEIGGTDRGRSRFRALLGSLGGYLHAERDVRGFRALLQDVEESIEDGTCRAFELAVLGGMIRHASVLACYLTGPPVFGRESSIRTAAERFEVGADFADLFTSLYAFHLWEQGRSGRPPIELESRTSEALVLAHTFLDRLEAAIP